jgi:pimeloyl-ACP methyl ester carboxylesterase
MHHVGAGEVRVSRACRRGALLATFALMFGAAACGSSSSDSSTATSPRLTVSSSSVASTIEAPAPAPAATTVPAPTTAPADVTTSTIKPVTSRSVVTADDGHELVVWKREPSGESKGEIVLLHGITWSARPNFDLQVPGQNVSLMDTLAERGYTVYAVDQRGYGDTERDETGWFTLDRGALDVQNVTDWVAAQSPGNRRPVLLGYSMGSLTAMLAAQRNPDAISDLVLYAVPFDTTAAPGPEDEPLDPPREPTTAESAAEDFITPEATPAGVKEAFVELATTLDPVRVDWRDFEQLGEIDPTLIRTPTLLIYGDRDPYANSANLPAFFERLGTTDRSQIVLPGVDHVAHLEHQAEFADALQSFIERNT